jgi:carboxylesterase type B
MSVTWARWRTCSTVAVAALTLGALVAAVPLASASILGGQAVGSGPVAGTANGAVRGLAVPTSGGAVDEFLGIPYAAPPVGALRWQPPQPAASWSGVRDATQFAPHCPQLGGPFGEASTSEDCLFLNVFTPSHRQAGSHFPVMVWIHGGALVSGESNDYDPTALVEDGVTVVTINYRLGALGFLAHPALAAGEAFATKAGCASQTAACLRSLPVSTILADQDAAGYTPNINSDVLPETLGAAFASGTFNRVPIINGTNHDEWRLFVALSELEGNPVTASNYESMISSTLGVPAAVAAVIAAKYPLTAFPSPSVALGAVGTDAIFACPALTIDQSVSRFVPTFAYEFNDENAPENFLPPVSFPYGAAHASEIQYLMGLPTAAFPGMLSAQQQQLATIMKGYWTNLAKRGLPGSFGTAFWPLFNTVTQEMQSLVPPAPRTETDFATTHNCAFWTSLEAS